MNSSRITQQTIHEFNRCMPVFSNENYLEGKLDHLIIPIPDKPDLVQLRCDFFETHSSGTPKGEHESLLFNTIDVDSATLNISTLLRMKLYCCKETPRIDLINKILYLNVKGMIAALVFTDKLKNELHEASGIIRFLIHEDYSILEENPPIRELTTALFFLHLIATGYRSAFDDYWIADPLYKIIKQNGIEGRRLISELYAIQLEYCKTFF